MFIYIFFIILTVIFFAPVILVGGFLLANRINIAKQREKYGSPYSLPKIFQRVEADRSNMFRFQNGYVGRALYTLDMKTQMKHLFDSENTWNTAKSVLFIGNNDEGILLGIDRYYFPTDITYLIPYDRIAEIRNSTLFPDLTELAEITIKDANILIGIPKIILNGFKDKLARAEISI